ncbi:MotA/TolQ/ExbB proton channel family protein [bacterium]|nr:MotA/TolQ/ExbB proton channel family protein [bacterium]
MLAKIAMAFEQGGFFMYPIMIIQLVSIAIIIERAYFLFMKRKTNNIDFVTQMEETIRRGDIDLVIAKTEGMKESTLATAINAGATAAKNLGGKEEIQGRMDEVLIAENAALDKRTSFLSMLGNVATLTGLLGTITGMIKSFAAVSYANPSEKAALLSAGISEAMNATAYGLITAIPALVAYAILVNRTNVLMEELTQGALKAFNLLSFAYDPMTVKGLRYKNNQAE